MDPENAFPQPGPTDASGTDRAVRRSLAIGIAGMLIHSFIIFSYADTFGAIYSTFRPEQLPFVSKIIINLNDYFMLHAIAVAISWVGIHNLLYRIRPDSISIGTSALTLLFLLASIADHYIGLPVYLMIIP